MYWCTCKPCCGNSVRYVCRIGERERWVNGVGNIVQVWFCQSHKAHKTHEQNVLLCLHIYLCCAICRLYSVEIVATHTPHTTHNSFTPFAPFSLSLSLFLWQTYIHVHRIHDEWMKYMKHKHKFKLHIKILLTICTIARNVRKICTAVAVVTGNGNRSTIGVCSHR